MQNKSTRQFLPKETNSQNTTMQLLFPALTILTSFAIASPAGHKRDVADLAKKHHHKGMETTRVNAPAAKTTHVGPCTDVKNNLIVCSKQGEDMFSICFDGKPSVPLTCAAGSVCCGHAPEGCVFPHDVACKK